MSDKDIKYWIGFSINPSIDRVKFSQFVHYFSKLEDTWEANTEALKHADSDGNSVNAITSWRPRINLDKDLKQLTAEPTHIDEVYPNTDLPTATVSSTLTMMELKGIAKQIGIMSYILTREAKQEYRVQVD